MENGKWKVVKMENGKWKMENGKWKMSTNMYTNDTNDTTPTNISFIPVDVHPKHTFGVFEITSKRCWDQ
jgi:hypothetical protein